MLGKYDPVMPEHVTRAKLGSKNRISYLSPAIQNEFINILGEKVRTRIIDEINYFSIIFDSTPDVSRKDQTSQILRYVTLEGGTFRITESASVSEWAGDGWQAS